MKALLLKSIKIVVVTGDKIQDLIPEIAALRIEVFREYPFLYIGDVEYEKRYLKKFTTMKDGIVVTVFDHQTLIGVSTGYPFTHEAENLKELFLATGRNPQDYFCFGESVLRKDYRGLGIGKRFFEEREAHVRALNRFTHLCFYTLIRPIGDPRCPADYRPLAPFWKSRGFVEHPELIGTVSYQEIGESEETPKKMVFWIKKLVFGILLTFSSLVFAESPEEVSSLKHYFFEKSGHFDAQKNAITLLIEDMLTWQGQSIHPSEVTTIVAFAFGNRILPNGNRIPGPVNKELADLVVRLQQQSGAHVYAQWEIAEAIASRISKEQLTAIYPVLDDKANVIYLSTIGVAEAIIEQTSKKGVELGKVAIIGFHDHVRRCFEIARKSGMDAYMPDGYTMPSQYDNQSGQPWTRNRLCYLEHELNKRLKLEKI